MAEVITSDEGKTFNQKMTKEGVETSVILDCLDNLSGRAMKIQVLVDSGLGKTVKGLRKHADAKVAAAADTLTSKWKDLVKAESKPSSSPAPPKTPSAATPGDAKKDKGQPSPKPAAVATTPKAPASVGAGDKRGRIRDLLAKSLCVQGTPTEELHVLAAEIEQHLYEHFKDANDAYTAHVKSIKFNLTDSKNSDFRARVVAGEIAPEQMPKLTSTQMAGRDKIEMKKANREAAIFQDQVFLTVDNQGTPSDMFECKKCKKRETTFYQKQTRGADEPMTVFITCKNRLCGHEWRE